MITIAILIVIILVGILLYAILKEREELGCYRLSIAKQCNENNSVFLINTKHHHSDTTDISIKRLISILSYHEKSAVWRRCFIISTILVFIIFLVTKVNNDNNNSKTIQNPNNIYFWIVLLLLFFTVLYFFFNYINYHHFRKLKENGVEILENLNKEGFK